MRKAQSPRDRIAQPICLLCGRADRKGPSSPWRPLKEADHGALSHLIDELSAARRKLPLGAHRACTKAHRLRAKRAVERAAKDKAVAEAKALAEAVADDVIASPLPKDTRAPAPA